MVFLIKNSDFNLFLFLEMTIKKNNLIIKIKVGLEL